jgi:hypothetical protein
VELGYTLSAAASKRLRLDRLRVFVNAVNPFTWSETLRKYDIDPETPTAYPAMKSWNTGITLQF